MRVHPGTISTALGLAGVGAFVVTPPWVAPYIGWGFILSAFAVLVGGIEVENGHLAAIPFRSVLPRLRVMWPQILMLLGALAFVAGLIAYLRPLPPHGGVQASGRGYVTPPSRSKQALNSPKVAAPAPASKPAQSKPSVTTKHPVHIQANTKPEVSVGIEVIRAPIKVGPAEPPPEPQSAPFVVPTPLAGLSNADLRARVHVLADGLRKFEQSYHMQEQDIGRQRLTGKTYEDQEAELAQRRTNLERLRAEETEKFRGLYMLDARDAFQEIVARAGRTPHGATQPQGKWGSEAFDAMNSGLISDHTPLMDLADFLEAYVKEID